MSRINTNVSSLLAQRILGQNNKGLTTSLERLSTGLAINRGADNPAGLIASENLRSEKASISAAISNAERADQVANIAEGGLQEISSLLIELQGLVGESANEAGLSQEEKEANQLQIDSIISTIDRVASSTSFQGTKLLNGTFDYQISSQNTRVSDFNINAAKLSHNETRTVQVLVTQSAQHGALYLSTGGNLDLGGPTSSFVFEIGGSKGSREFTFASGTTRAVMISAINTFTSVTGVSASQQSTGVFLKSTEYGSDAFVEFKVSDDGGITGADGILNVSSINEGVVKTGSATVFTSTNAIRDSGQDVGAVINGIEAVSKGLNARISSDFLDVELTLTTGTSGGATKLGSFTAFGITSGGAKFNLGPNVDIINQASLGISNVASRNLGDLTNGYLDDLGSGKTANVVDGDVAQAQIVVNEAISQVSTLRGRLGAFQKNTIGATIRSLGVALENTSAAESSIRDTDFAQETAALTRNQILVNAATNTLAIANSQPQSALALLG